MADSNYKPGKVVLLSFPHGVYGTIEPPNGSYLSGLRSVSASIFHSKSKGDGQSESTGIRVRFMEGVTNSRGGVVNYSPERHYHLFMLLKTYLENYQNWKLNWNYLKAKKTTIHKYNLGD